MAHASYDADCMKLLAGQPSDRIERFYQRMVDTVHSRLVARKLRRDWLEPIDYETFYDLMNEMSLTAEFGDGTRLALPGGQRSLQVLAHKLEKHHVIRVHYWPPAMERLREVLKGACMAVNSERWCESYEDYKGLIDNRARIFSRKEEQAIKWATIYQVPNVFTARVMKRQSTSEEDFRIRVDRMRAMRLITSTSILRGVFNESNVNEISRGFAAKYINDAHERIFSLTENNIRYFPH